MYSDRKPIITIKSSRKIITAGLFLSIRRDEESKQSSGSKSIIVVDLSFYRQLANVCQVPILKNVRKRVEDSQSGF